MSNKLKDVFSNKDFEFGGTLNFQNTEAQKSFFDALDIVQNEGRVVEVNGISSIGANVKDGDMIYPMTHGGKLTHVFIGPSVENVPITINTSFGKKSVDLFRYSTNTEVVLETSKEAIVFLKFSFNKSRNNIKFIYRMQIKFADNIKQIIESYYIALGIINYFFKQGEDRDASYKTLRNIRITLQITNSFWNKLRIIESKLNLLFDLTHIDKIEDILLDVEELYLLLIKNEAIRLDQKFTSTETTGIKWESNEDLPNIGSRINITFINKNTFSICGQSIVIYTANLLANAIIKEIIKDENGRTKILYGDTDSMPMYISYTGFLTTEEAEIEHNLIISSIEGPNPKYIEAISINEHLKQEMMYEENLV